MVVVRVGVRRCGRAMVGRRLAATSRGGEIRKEAARPARSLIGTTVAATALCVTGSVVLWPVADLWLGPKLAEMALTSWSRRDEEESTGSFELAVCGSLAAKEAADEAEGRGRPCAYVSLRTASSPHDLLFAFVGGIYSAKSLGLAGTLSQSMGTWWIVLFDILVSSEPAGTRAINLSILLNHLRRAMDALPHPPLIVVDHFDVACAHANQLDDDVEGRTLRRMLWHLGTWIAAAADDRAAHVLVGIQDPSATKLFKPPRRWSFPRWRGSSSSSTGGFEGKNHTTPQLAPAAVVHSADLQAELRTWLYGRGN